MVYYLGDLGLAGIVLGGRVLFFIFLFFLNISSSASLALNVVIFSEVNLDA